MALIDIAGHSGCSIEVVRTTEGRLLVRKSTDDLKYAQRLHAQGRKQIEAAGRIWGHIRVPHVHTLSCDTTSARIDMDYVYSRNFIDFFEEAGFSQIDFFMTSFIEWIDRQIKDCGDGELPREVVVDKASSVVDKAMMNPILSEQTLNLLPDCLTVISRLPETLHMPLGHCHGDLTFSNILFSGSNYYLIDFLDSFVESPLIDIVKLRQDTRHGWSRLMYRNRYDATRLDITCAHLDKLLDDHFSRYPWYQEYYSAFQLLNFMRILPYVKEIEIDRYLMKTLTGLLHSQP